MKSHQLILECLEDRCLPSMCVTEFSIPSLASDPTSIIGARDGNLWFTESDPVTGNKIGRITPAGEITEFPLPNAESQPSRITLGPDGNVWFTEFAGNRIGRITTDGVITEFPIPTPGSEPNGIVQGQHGDLWFTENAGNKIGRITLDGMITEFPVSTPGSRPGAITRDLADNLWFVEVSGNKIGRIDQQGNITEFTIPTPNSNPSSITLGLDGNLWFTEFIGDKIGRITPQGIITEFPTPVSPSRPNGITTGPDGYLWVTFAAGDVNSVRQLGLDGTFFSEVKLPTAQASPAGITEGPDGNVWFTELTGNKIGIVHLDPSRRFVQALYREVLGRRAGRAEEDFWLGVLVENGANALARGIEGSPEAHTRRVESWYADYLGRAADAIGREFFLGTLLDGFSEEIALSQLLGSDEFFNRQDDTPSEESFVRALYRELLEREPGSDDVAFWMTRLPTFGRTGVAQGFLESLEYRQKVIIESYASLLDRPTPPTEAEVNSWAAQQLFLLGIRVGIESSPEFYFQHHPSARHCFIDALYQLAAGRNSTQQEQHNIFLFLDGGSDAVVPVVLRSTEAYLNRVHDWYADFLDRSPDNAGQQFFVQTLVTGSSDEQALSIMLGSQEYFDRSPQVLGQAQGPSAPTFVRALYQQLLGRSARDGEVQYWVNSVATSGRDGVALGFLQSAEYRRLFVGRAYAEILHRIQAPTPGEVDFWVQASLGIAGIREALASSLEFYNNG